MTDYQQGYNTGQQDKANRYPYDAMGVYSGMGTRSIEYERGYDHGYRGDTDQ